MIRPQLVRSFTHAALSPEPDLAVAALMIARVEYPKLDARPYLDQLDAIGSEARQRVACAPALDEDEAPVGTDPQRYAQVMALNQYLFGEMRFVGNELHYEDPRNSFLNEVLERRTGIPITLALLYIEIARRAGMQVEGVNFPGHFLLRCRARRGLPYEDLIIDAFHGGALLSRDLLRRQAGEEFAAEGDEERFESRLLPHATKPQILARMLLNLKRLYVRMYSFPQARDVTELLVAVDPSAINELRDRGLLAYHLKDFASALRDLEMYLRLTTSSGTAATDTDEHATIWEHVKTLRKRVASLN
ncbi:MAG TPA: transglutaminase-like domain-containing protein [Vicinamibacterales bacterium]|nr:transglutaminase-like domain-containing protein [Vicinamibacterales bacterium]